MAMASDLKVKMVNRSGYPAPVYETAGASGLDLRAAIKKPVTLKPHTVTQIPTGIYLEMPNDIEAQVRARSGLALKRGIAMVNGVGTIDADYRGEISCVMIDLIDESYEIKPGDRIAQLVFMPVAKPVITVVESLDDLSETERGAGGFGHTGKQ